MHAVSASQQLRQALSDIAVITKDTVHSAASRRVACVLALVHKRHDSKQGYLEANMRQSRHGQFVHADRSRKTSRIVFATIATNVADDSLALRLPALRDPTGVIATHQLPWHQELWLQDIQQQWIGNENDLLDNVRASMLRPTMAFEETANPKVRDEVV